MLRKIYRLTGNSLAGTKTQIATIASSPPAPGKVLLIKYNISTGLVSAYYDGALVTSATDTTYIAETFKGGFAVAGFNSQVGVGSATAYNVIHYAVTSINGGSPFTASQTSSSAETTGFTGGGVMSSITATWGAYSLPITNIGGTLDDPTFDKGVRVDGQVYPKNGETLNFTFIKRF